MENNILKININNYKTIIKDLEFTLSPKKLNYFIGKNGVGKSNILSAINHCLNYVDDTSVKPISVNGNVDGDFKLSLNILSKNDIRYHSNEDSKNIFVRKERIKDEISRIVNEEFGGNSLLNLNFNDESSDDYSIVQVENKLIDLNLPNYNDLLENYNETYDAIENEFFSNNKELRLNHIVFEELEEKAIKSLGNVMNDTLSHQKFKELRKILKKIKLFYSKKDNLKVKYIKHFENLISHDIEYNMSEWRGSNYSIRGMMNKSLETLFSFLFSIQDDKGRELKRDLNHYLRMNSYVNSIDQENRTDNIPELVQLPNLREKINEVINKSLDNFFESNLNGSFDFSLKAIINGDKIQFLIKSKNTYDYDDNRIVKASDGAKALLNNIISIESLIYRHSNGRDKGKIIFLLDEPEKNMYPSLQRKFVEYLDKKINNNNSVYIAITTHHSSMIPQSEFTLNVIERESSGNTKIKIKYGNCDFDNEVCLNSNEQFAFRDSINKIIDSNIYFEDLLKS